MDPALPTASLSEEQILNLRLGIDPSGRKPYSMLLIRLPCLPQLLAQRTIVDADQAGNVDLQRGPLSKRTELRSWRPPSTSRGRLILPGKGGACALLLSLMKHPTRIDWALLLVHQAMCEPPRRYCSLTTCEERCLHGFVTVNCLIPRSLGTNGARKLVWAGQRLPD